ncbi:MAG: helix-turn-helix domain-containing protein [Polyangiaceae bacterium]|nr:helix-turn-helix domain-containing protein [Polyangiaceae bacterium]
MRRISRNTGRADVRPAPAASNLLPKATTDRPIGKLGQRERVQRIRDAAIGLAVAIVEFAQSDAPEPSTQGEFTPHTKSVLGKRPTLNLIRAGAFPDAYKVGKTWFIPTDDLNAYIQKHGKRAPANVNGDEGQHPDVQALASELGFGLTGRG